MLAGSEQEIEEAVADKGYHKAESRGGCRGRRFARLGYLLPLLAVERALWPQV